MYGILREKEVSVDSTTWNRRYREYMDKIKTGSVFEIAEVLRDLYLLRSDKDLSFGERKMLDTARSLLIKELAIAKACDEQDVEDGPEEDLQLLSGPPPRSSCQAGLAGGARREGPPDRRADLGPGGGRASAGGRRRGPGGAHRSGAEAGGMPTGGSWPGLVGRRVRTRGRLGYWSRGDRR